MMIIYMGIDEDGEAPLKWDCNQIRAKIRRLTGFGGDMTVRTGSPNQSITIIIWLCLVL